MKIPGNSGWSYLVPCLVVLSFFFIIPLFYSVNVSLLKYDPFLFWKAGAYTLDNYVNFFSDPFNIYILYRTTYLALAVTILSLLTGYPVAYAMARLQSRTLRALGLAAFLSPYFVSTIVRVYGWIYILANNGIINSMLITLGIISQPIQLLYNINGVIIGLVEITLPLAIFAMYGVIGSIDRRLELAARSLGATPSRTFVKVTFPLSLPGVVAASLLVFGTTIGAFIHPEILGGGYVNTLGTMVYTQIVSTMQFPSATAVGFIMLAIFALSIIVYTKIIKRLSPVPLGV